MLTMEENALVVMWLKMPTTNMIDRESAILRTPLCITPNRNRGGRSTQDYLGEVRPYTQLAGHPCNHRLIVALE